jgi:subtilisin family serine protease
MVSVGSFNPGGLNRSKVTVSVYSNTGPWVMAYRCGTAVISTMPVTFNGSIRSVLNMPKSSNPTRGSIDLDDYSRGFGTWSGTSFAAPALAGDIAAQLVQHGSRQALAPADFEARADLASAAVAVVLKSKKP